MLVNQQVAPTGSPASFAMIKNRSMFLTLTELELLPGFWLAGFLTFNNAWITGYKTFSPEGRFVFRIDLDQGPGNSETEGFSLTGHPTTVNIHFDVVIIPYLQQVQGLFNYVMKLFIRKIVFEISAVYDNLALAVTHVYPGNGSFPSSYRIDNIHVLFYFIKVKFLWLLCFMRVVLTGIHMQVVKDGASKSALGEHAFYSFLHNRFGLFSQQIFGSPDTLTTRVTCVTEVFFIAHLFAGKLNFFGIDHDDVIATIHMRSETWLMLSSEDHCYY